jgi:hypothetical protein
MNSLALRFRSFHRILTKPTFNLQMAYASLVILLVSIAGCRVTLLEVPSAVGMIVGGVFVIVAVLPLPLWLKEKGKLYLRDSVLTILWAVLLWGLLHYPVAVAARLGMSIHLQDSNFVRWDQAMGVSVPGIMAWANHHWLGKLANQSYGLLVPLLMLSIVLPILTGKVKSAQQFLLANLVAFALGLPLFVLFPAVGPWYGFHFAIGAGQAECQAAFLLIRQPGLSVYRSAEFICFPSFHVIWAILCAQALWGIRLLRVPVAVLAGFILFSTLTTGWHYFSDVLAGILVAVLAIAAAKWLGREREAA